MIGFGLALAGSCCAAGACAVRSDRVGLALALVAAVLIGSAVAVEVAG